MPRTERRCPRLLAVGRKRVLGGFRLRKKLASLKPVNSQVFNVKLIMPQP